MYLLFCAIAFVNLNIRHSASGIAPSKTSTTNTPAVNTTTEATSFNAFHKPSICHVTDFKQLTKCSTFIDKTLFISEFFNDTAPFQLITCPRKFGKSTVLNMMKNFVQSNADDKYKKPEETHTFQSYRMFTNANLNLKIASYLDKSNPLYLNHFNRYPVIQVNFKSTIPARSYATFLANIRESIKSCYESYEWLYRSLLSPSDTNSFPTKNYQVQFMRKVLENQIDEDDIAKSLFELSKILHQYLEGNNKVFVLLDDYDSPIYDAVQQNTDAIRVTELIRAMIAKLLDPDNQHIAYALITGTSDLLQEKIANIQHRRFLSNHKYSEYFGFTENEVQTLYTLHNITSNEHYQISKWYGGYTVESQNQTPIKLYNPYSVINYISSKTPNSDTGVLQHYWTIYGVIPNFLQYFKQIPAYRNLVTKLHETQSIEMNIKKTLTLGDLSTFQQMIHPSETISYHEKNLFFNHLFDYGFLSHYHNTRYILPNLETSSYIYCLFVDPGHNITTTSSASETSKICKKLRSIWHNIRKIFKKNV